MRFDLELRDAAGDAWAAQLAHPFVTGLGDGTLPRERFQHYVAQDYLFLVDYGRLLALATARAPDLPTMRRFAELTQSILVTEMNLHRGFAAEWGISEPELVAARPEPATLGYVDFLVRTAAIGDFAELAAALLPCMWSYAEIGTQLSTARAEGRADPGPYSAWVDTYASAEFGGLSDWCRALVDEISADAGPAVRGRMRAAFRTAVEHEVRFWESSWQR
ncbi:MAG: thiaminase II [Solirubrobacteraceae bacterium]|nr:thiaminase II [Solirubrobacteraceae bacterium]